MTKFKDIIQESVANREAFQETEELNEAIVNKNLDQVFNAANAELNKRLGLKLKYKLKQRNNYITNRTPFAFWTRVYDVFSGSVNLGHMTATIRGKPASSFEVKGTFEFAQGSGVMAVRDVGLIQQAISDQMTKKFAKTISAEITIAHKEVFDRIK